MKTEPNVQHFTVLAKERICHALAQVISNGLFPAGCTAGFICCVPMSGEREE